jgi:hypothetical protein
MSGNNTIQQRIRFYFHQGDPWLPMNMVVIEHPIVKTLRIARQQGRNTRGWTDAANEVVLRVCTYFVVFG